MDASRAIADELDERGAVFPNFEPDTQKQVDGLLQRITHTKNPVDTGRPLPEFGQVTDAVARDSNVDIVVYEIYEDSLGYPLEELETLSETVDEPVLFTVAGPADALEEERLQMEEVGVPTFQAPERGEHAVAALIDSISDE